MAFNLAVRLRQCRQPEVCRYERGVAVILLTELVGGRYHITRQCTCQDSPFSLSTSVIFSV